MSDETAKALNNIAKALRALGSGDLLDEVNNDGAIEKLTEAVQEAGAVIGEGLQAVAAALASRR